MSADPHNDWGTRWPPGPIEAQVRTERDLAVRKVQAVEALCIKYRTPPRDGRIPICQVLAAWLEIEENQP